MRWWYVRQGGQIRWGLGVPRKLWWVLILWVQCGQLGKGSGRSRATQVSPGMRQSPAWLGPPPPPGPCTGWGISDLHPGSPWGSKASLQQG